MKGLQVQNCIRLDGVKWTLIKKNIKLPGTRQSAVNGVENIGVHAEEISCRVTVEFLVLWSNIWVLAGLGPKTTPPASCCKQMRCNLLGGTVFRRAQRAGEEH